MSSCAAPDVISARQRHNILSRHHGPDHPRTREARRELRYATLAQLIRETVDLAPPLTPEQRADLAALLRTGGE